MSNLESIYLLHQRYGKTIRQKSMPIRHHIMVKKMDIDKEIEGIKRKHYASRKALWKLMGGKKLKEKTYSINHL